VSGRDENNVLLTDLYELTMAASCFKHEMFAPATFSLSIRKYPRRRMGLRCDTPPNYWLYPILARFTDRLS